MQKAHVNEVHLIGYLGKDAQMVELGSGMKKASFSMATNESYVNAKGEAVNKTTWHNIVAWGKKAELAVSLVKGNKVEIKGSIGTRSYVGKDGSTRLITEVIATFIERKEMVIAEEVLPEI